MGALRRYVSKVGALRDVKYPEYGYEIDWEKEAARFHMSVSDMEKMYEQASSPGTQTSIVYKLTDSWLRDHQESPAAKAFRFALASNPANSLLGLMRLYPEYPKTVRENPALPMLVLESPESYRIQRAMSVPIWELFEQMKELFNTDGRRPPSIEVVRKIRHLMSLGYNEEDINGLQTILRSSPTYWASRNNEYMNRLWEFWKWVLEWNLAIPVDDEPGFVVVYAIADKSRLKEMLEQSPVYSTSQYISPDKIQSESLRRLTWVLNSKEPFYCTYETSVWRTVVNSPYGNFPIVYCSPGSAKMATRTVRQFRKLKASELIILPIKVNLDEVQPLVNLGNITSSLLDYGYASTEGALRQSSIPLDRFIFPNIRKKAAPKSKVGAVKIQLGLIAEVKTNMPLADFWLIRVGTPMTVGMPTKEFKPENIGIRVIRTDRVLPEYLYHAMVYLHTLGYWKDKSTGITGRKSIRIDDVKSVEFTG